MLPGVVILDTISGLEPCNARCCYDLEQTLHAFSGKSAEGGLCAKAIGSHPWDTLSNEKQQPHLDPVHTQLLLHIICGLAIHQGGVISGACAVELVSASRRLKTQKGSVTMRVPPKCRSTTPSHLAAGL